MKGSLGPSEVGGPTGTRQPARSVKFSSGGAGGDAEEEGATLSGSLLLRRRLDLKRKVGPGDLTHARGINLRFASNRTILLRLLEVSDQALVRNHSVLHFLQETVTFPDLKLPEFKLYLCFLLLRFSLELG